MKTGEIISFSKGFSRTALKVYSARSPHRPELMAVAYLHGGLNYPLCLVSLCLCSFVDLTANRSTFKSEYCVLVLVRPLAFGVCGNLMRRGVVAVLLLLATSTTRVVAAS